MRNIGLHEWFSESGIAEALIERCGMRLSMHEQHCCSQALRFLFHLPHEIFAVSLFALRCQHASYEPLTGFGSLEQAGISNHMAFMEKRQIVDSIHILITAVLFGVENLEAGFEDFV